MSVSSCAGGVSFFCFKAAVVVSKAPFADPFSFSLSRALATISKTPFADLFSSFPLHIYGDDIQSSTRRDPSVRILFIHDFEVPIPDPLNSLYSFRQFMRWKDMWDVTQIGKNTFRESCPLHVFHKLSNIVVAVAVLL